jgi:hypothetical protein
MNDKALRITSNPQGATGSIEWVIERVNWLDDKPAANMDEATPIRSPIFACCGHRWQFTLKAAFKQKSKVDENKENIMTGFYLFLARDEPKDVIAVTSLNISGDNINDRYERSRKIFKPRKTGWGHEQQRSEIQNWAKRSLNGRIIIRVDITIIDEQFDEINCNNGTGLSIQEKSKQQLSNDFQQLLSTQSNW